MKRPAYGLLVLTGLALLLLAACAPAAQPTQAEQLSPTAEAAIATSLPTQAAASTFLPTATALPALPTQIEATPAQPTAEARLVELEWPLRLRMGESDIVRLALVPSAEGYTATAEFPEHPLDTTQLQLRRPEGYTLVAVARLDGVGFALAPMGDQPRVVPVGEGVSWRWSLTPQSPGKQRLTVSLLLRWEPETGSSAPVRESAAYGRGLDVQVTSFLGLGRAETLWMGLVGAVMSVGLGLFVFIRRGQPGTPATARVKPNPALVIEPGPGMALTSEDQRLMQSLFARYTRLVLEGEFLSGYSGSRTFLARPLHADGSSDATTIVKLGPRAQILAEYGNYEAFVKDRLPPVTARIQHAPVELRGARQAALQYTCIAEPGRPPLSLRQALLANPDPGLIHRLFETFAPNWWMQRQPYAFRLGVEYDRVLPPHYVLVPAQGASLPTYSLSETDNPAEVDLRPGDLVRVAPFSRCEPRAGGQSYNLIGQAAAGQAALRLRWDSPHPPAHHTARVTAMRYHLLAEAVTGFERFDLPDPLVKLNGWLQEPVMGSRSTIHGDLNLENILVGPGSLVWLIDFAQTREGHPLFDFAHLAAQIVAHVLSVALPAPEEFVARLRSGADPLLAAVEDAARACLFDPRVMREYQLALAVSCLGALKYRNLSAHARHCLYLCAAWVGAQIGD